MVYPAAFPEVLACAALDVNRQPWKCASAGPQVDVLAPGVDVQRAYSRRAGPPAGENYFVGPSTGTTFATACSTGLAALWLSYHGGRQALLAHYGGNGHRVAEAFHYLMRRTAQPVPATQSSTRYGAGLPDAAALLRHPLPQPEELDDFGQELQLQLAEPNGEDLALFNGLTVGEAGSAPDAGATALAGRLGLETGGPLFGELLPELRFHFSSNFDLFESLCSVFLLDTGPGTLRERLLASGYLSPMLQERLEAAQLDPGRDGTAEPVPPREIPRPRFQPPAYRRLQVYASDPSLDASLGTTDYNRVSVDVRWEEVREGPIGEYLEVVDVDPASGFVYAPVDLNAPAVLANGGLEPDEGNPHFHQQMVYAVAMKTVAHFERALGRPIFWATAPYQDEAGRWLPEPFVQRLRIYPHALRARNAYYSPTKRALLFGYFRAPGPPGSSLGPTVFTCLSYDIIAHETTHALLDGMYRRYIEATNPDVLAFHEAFADIVALFQHFTHPNVLHAAIEQTRGDLESDSMLGKLAIQFGEAIGSRGALRDAIGWVDEEGRWQRRKPDPELLRQDAYRISAHKRGSILVVAVFDAFLKIYQRRARPLIRLATGGSGVLLPGDIPTVLARVLAEEAAKAAGHVLNICIRALDYLPPVDITFGEYLRAIITADRDLVPNDPRGYRVAFAEAFRAWGIYPEGIMTITPESLCWAGPGGAWADFTLDPELLDDLNRLLIHWRVTRDRAELHAGTLQAKRKLNWLLRQGTAKARGSEIGIRFENSFEVHTLRPAFSIGPDDEMNQMIVMTLTQKPEASGKKLRIGSTFLFNLWDGSIRYLIYRRDGDGRRAEGMEIYRAMLAEAGAESDPYTPAVYQAEPFAALHLAGHL